MVGVETLKGPRPTPIGSQKGPQKGRLRHPGERKTERAGPKGQTFHGHGEQRAPLRATERTRRPHRRSRRFRSARQAGDGVEEGVWGGAPPRRPSFQTSKHPSFQTSKLPSFQASKLPSIQASKLPNKKPPAARSGAFVAWGRITRRGRIRQRICRSGVRSSRVPRGGRGCLRRVCR